MIALCVPPYFLWAMSELRAQRDDFIGHAKSELALE
jgi:hypothetical protein